MILEPFPKPDTLHTIRRTVDVRARKRLAAGRHNLE